MKTVLNWSPWRWSTTEGQVNERADREAPTWDFPRWTASCKGLYSVPIFHLLVSTKQIRQHASTLCAYYEQWNSLKGCVLACFWTVVLDSPFKRCHLNWSRVSLWCIAPEHARTCIQPQNVLSEEQTKFMQNCAWPLHSLQPATPRGHNEPAPTCLLCHVT